jgi:hypothetical protein
MAKANAKGAIAAISFFTIVGTLGVGLYLDWMVWSGLLIAPMIFQLAAGQAWRSLRPTAIMEYLAARSAARRFAFSLNSKDLTIQLLFKGTLLRTRSEDDIKFTFDSVESVIDETKVWIALLTDSIVMMSESKEGASLEVAKVIDDKFQVQGVSAPGDSTYANSRKIRIGFREGKKGVEKRFVISSKFPAALIVLEKRLMQILENARAQAIKRSGEEEKEATTSKTATKQPPQELDALDRLYSSMS